MIIALRGCDHLGHYTGYRAAREQRSFQNRGVCRGRLPMGILGILLIAIALLAVPAAAKTITVAADGTGDYVSLNSAITAADAGDTIVIDRGMYTESSYITINQSDITVRGKRPETTILDMADTQVSITGSGCRIENLTFIGTAFVLSVKAPSCVIRNNIFKNPRTAVNIQSSYNFIENNVILIPKDASGGIYLADTNASFNYIRDNFVSGATKTNPISELMEDHLIILRIIQLVVVPKGREYLFISQQTTLL